ncbi:bifunctional non-homologous end joining protein LigD [Nocardioides albertanoniae]|uniref:DNA ligase (ATP) n=1 Tax=Nocardioides albertanoniae TaxID=1175486 RepID=A0A543AAP5_9ACTN|nr:non-homologous end-joining DNA ligase [Nocardioides albertanoniae]TQL69674.1 bifunctional non-homologous end joining protein LigD [Nocardioides albertanoniae]
MPPMLRPMLATPGDHPPLGDAWVHEVKWDGIRLLGASEEGRTQTRLVTRNGNDATPAWPEIATGPERDVVVDGEVIALNDAGLPDFRVLMDRMHNRDARRAARFAERIPATYMVFDLLRLDGRLLVEEPWAERRKILERLVESGDLSSWQVPQTYDDGQMLHAVTREQGLEGIVSKRRSSRYRPGERTKDWVKLAHRYRASLVVGGWRPEVGTEGGTERLGALLVGQPTPDGLVYRGRVGSGIGGKRGRRLAELLRETPRSPFAGPDVDRDGGVPPEDARGTHWVEPLLVVEVETHGSAVAAATYKGRLRQPSFIGIRDDIEPKDL